MRGVLSKLSANVLLGLVALVIACGGAIATDSATLHTKRVALVIGNSNYKHTVFLRNPVNDARLIAQTLEGAGFEVTRIIDADLATIKRAMLKFGRSLRNSPEAGLFYYAGHGVQVRGENYLIPVDAKITDEDEIDLEAINLNSFLRVMNSSNSSINIVVLDACRNNPFARSFRSVSRGLATLEAPKGTYIGYATAPGDVAADGGGENSPYSVALAAAIKVPGITIEQVFKRTRLSVLNATGNNQVPWETSSITGNFYFHKPKKPEMPKPVSQNAPTDVNTAASVYNQIKDSKNIEVLEIFSKRFSGSIFAEFTRARIKSLQVADLPPKRSAESAEKVTTTPLEKAPEKSRANPAVSTEQLMSQAEAAFANKNFEKTAKLYSQATARDDVEATYRLGRLYAKGQGVRQDYKEAVRLFKKAAAENHLKATYKLGFAHEFGKGIDQDYKEAARLYQLGASKNHSESLFSLGILYHNGQGVVQDHKEAARLYQLAITKNNSGALFNLGILYHNGQGVGRDYKEAARLY